MKDVMSGPFKLPGLTGQFVVSTERGGTLRFFAAGGAVEAVARRNADGSWSPATGHMAMAQEKITPIQSMIENAYQITEKGRAKFFAERKAPDETRQAQEVQEVAEIETARIVSLGGQQAGAPPAGAAVAPGIPVGAPALRPDFTGVGGELETILGTAPAAIPPGQQAQIGEAPQGPVGLNRFENAALREYARLEAYSPEYTETFVEVANRAKAAKLDEQAMDFAREAIEGRRMIFGDEHVGMLIKSLELKAKLNDAFRDQIRLQESGDSRGAETARARSALIQDEIDTLTRGARLGGRETSRGLGARRIKLDPVSYDVASLLTQGRVAKNAPLTPADETKLADFANKIADLEARIAERDARHAAEVADLTAKNAATEVIREKRKAAKAKRGRDAILAEREQIKRELAALGLRVNSVAGLDPQAAYLVGKLAVNYIHEGATNLREVVDKVRADLPDLLPQDIIATLNARDPTQQKRGESEIKHRVRELKARAKVFTDMELAEEGIIEPPQKGKRADPAVAALRKHLTELRDNLYKTELDPKRLEKAVTTINRLQDQLAKGYRLLPRKPAEASQEIIDARAKAAELRRTIQVTDEIARLQEQLRTRQFEVADPRPAKKRPKDLERLEVELHVLKRQVRQAIDDMQPITAWRVFSEGVNTLRAIKATADMSATLRQALLLSVLRPVTAGKIFAKATKAFFSEYTAEQVDMAIRAMPHHWIREKAGLRLSETGGPATAREEFFSAQWIERVPVFGEIIRASHRHMATTLNLLRVAAFDEFLAANPNASDIELKAWADFVNVASGRGNLGVFEPTAPVLGVAFFAPRFAISRIQTPFKLAQYWKLPRVRKAIAKELTAFGGVMMTALGLASLAGWDVGDDPRDPDFGKITAKDGAKIVTFDLFAGFIQPARLLARAITWATDELGWSGQHLPKEDKDFGLWEALGRFATYKASPAVTLTKELLTGESLFGEKRTRLESLGRGAMPIIVESVMDAYKTEIAKPLIAAGATGEFLGMNVSAYERSERAMRKEIRTLLQNGDDAAADTLRIQWNVRHPDKRIINVETDPNVGEIKADIKAFRSKPDRSRQKGETDEERDARLQFAEQQRSDAAARLRARDPDAVRDAIRSMGLGSAVYDRISNEE